MELREAICTLMQISRTLKANRKQRGALELDGMETRALINQDKNIDDIILSEVSNFVILIVDFDFSLWTLLV